MLRTSVHALKSFSLTALGSTLARWLGGCPDREFACSQGLTLVHFSAQLEPCLTQETTLHILDTPSNPLNTGYITPMRTPCSLQSAQVELESERV